MLTSAIMKQFISISLIGLVVAVSCNNPQVNNDKEAAMKAQQFTIDSMRQEIAKKRIVDSMNQIAVVNKEATKDEVPVAATRPVRTRYRTRTVYVNQGGSNTASANGATSAEYAGYSQTQPARKKGWSAKAKGAAIGAGVGALSGALIGKEKGKGAIIGGVLGAGAGLGTGAIIDHKKKKEEQGR
jgi:hypothetical protein